MIILLLADDTVFDTIDFGITERPDEVLHDEMVFAYEATEDNGNHVYREVEL
jgi:hypothetical protein